MSSQVAPVLGTVSVDAPQQNAQLDAALSMHHVAGLSFTPEQLERRRFTLGASEIAAVAGLNPYQSALDIFLLKMGSAQPFTGNEFTEWGLRLEDPIALAYAERMNVSLRRGDHTVHGSESWMSATPDRFAVDSHTYDDHDLVWGVEVKNKSARQAPKFGDAGTDQVPLEIAAQCHWSMLVTGLTRWDVAALFGGNEFRAYELHFDAEIAAGMQEIGHAFWHNHVLKGIAPDVDGSKSATEWLKKQFTKHSDVILQATREQDGWMQQLKEVREQAESLEAQENLLINRLKQVIGENAGIQGRAGRVTWKAPKPSTTCDYASAIGHVRVAARDTFDFSIAREVDRLLDNALIAFTTQRPGSRRFLPTFAKV